MGCNGRGRGKGRDGWEWMVDGKDDLLSKDLGIKKSNLEKRYML